jgi:hypothetical protein
MSVAHSNSAYVPHPKSFPADEMEFGEKNQVGSERQKENPTDAVER